MEKLDPNATIKTSGVIHYNSVRLPEPCLWIGRLAPTEPDVHFAADDELNPFNGPFHPGEFCIYHPYQGSSCDYVTLRGIFLPISTCGDNAIRDQLTQLHTRYGEHAFASVDPNLDELVEMHDALRAIGPLDMTVHFRAAGQAYMPFTCSAHAYSWIAHHFAMMTVIHEYPDRAVQIQACDRVPWASVEEFTSWIHRLPELLSESAINTLILGAFIYPNTDACDGWGYGTADTYGKTPADGPATET